MISSNWFLFQEEIVKIKHYMEKKMYPLNFVSKQVKVFLKNKMSEKNHAVNITNNLGCIS